MIRGQWMKMLALALVWLWVPSTALADTLYLKDGRKLEGQVVKDGLGKITFKVVGEVGYTQEFPQDEVDRVEKSKPGATTKPASVTGGTASRPTSKPSGKMVMEVPITGVFGLEVNADVIKKCMKLAESGHVDVVVFVIDSPGGSVATLMDILKAKAANKNVLYVAYVKKAMSAAAVLAMSCPVIVMDSTGSIGATVVYRRSPGGTVTLVDEKFRAALGAEQRSYITEAGHDPLLMDAMGELEVQVGIEQTDTGSRLVRNGGRTILKESGSILALTAGEAVEVGLAKTKVASYEELLKTLNLTPSEKHTSPGKMVQEWLKQLQIEQKKYELGMKQLAEEYKLAHDLYRRLEPDFDKAHKAIKRARDQLSSAEAVIKRTPCLVDFGKVKYSARQMAELHDQLDELEKSIKNTEDYKRKYGD